MRASRRMVKFTDEWHEQGVRCRVYPKKGRPEVAEYVECFVSKKERFTVFVKDDQTPVQAVVNHPRFAGLVAIVAGDSAPTHHTRRQHSS